MTQERLMRRLSAANPTPTGAQPPGADELFALIVAEPGDARLARTANNPILQRLTRLARRRAIGLAAASSTAIAAIAAAVVLVLGATTGAAPAYALIHNADGSITISLNNLTTGISQLNARLHQMGINETVIPVTPNCSFTTPVLSAAPGSLNETITIGTTNDEPAGVDGVLAAEQLPNGSIALLLAGMKAPLPSCISPAIMKVQPSNTPDSASAAK